MFPAWKWNFPRFTKRFLWIVENIDPPFLLCRPEYFLFNPAIRLNYNNGLIGWKDKRVMMMSMSNCRKSVFEKKKWKAFCGCRITFSLSPASFNNIFSREPRWMISVKKAFCAGSSFQCVMEEIVSFPEKLRQHLS